MTGKITLELTLDELKTLDKHIEYNEETKSVFDKIKNAYPQPKMTDEQIDMLRRLIQDEIEVAQVDGMEHGVWGFMDSQLDKRWKQFQESFNG